MIGRATTISRRNVLIGTAGFGFGLATSTVAGASLMLNERKPALTLLGSGKSLSVLINSGGARVLILSGSDPADFGNALSRARFPMLDRVDMMIVANPGTNISFVEDALQKTGSPMLFTVGSADHLLESGIAVQGELVLPHRFQLPDSTALTLPAAPLESNAPEGQWVATVSRRSHTVLMSAGPGSDDLAGYPRQPSAWIRLDGDVPIDALRTLQPNAVLVPAGAVSGPDMRAQLTGEGMPPVYGYRIHAGDTARIGLDDSEIELPDFPSSSPV